VVGTAGRGKAEAPQAWNSGERLLSGPGSLRVNSQWDLTARPVGAARSPQFDVDLGAMYELVDGSRGVVQQLGGLRGAFERAPFVSHDRDDRAGSAAGENVFVNLDRGRLIRRVLMFLYSHNGPLANGRITVDFHPPAGTRPFRIVLDHIPADAHACALALLTPSGEQWTLNRQVRYVAGFQSDLDGIYGFGLRWARQDKSGL
jgi:tellurite resistance protein TerA